MEQEHDHHAPPHAVQAVAEPAAPAAGIDSVIRVATPDPERGGINNASATPAPTGTSSTDLATPPPLIDPVISQRKFEREITNYHAMETEYLRRGWLLVRAEFPTVVVLLAAPQIVPSPVLFGVVIDFTNYDFWAPSVRFVHPFTLAPLSIADMPTPFRKRVPVADGGFDFQSLLQHQADQAPFLCVVGVREYHDHPFHSNDPWLAHRGTGPGTLYHILNIIHRYGVAPFSQFGIQIRSMEFAVGLRQPDPPNIPE